MDISSISDLLMQTLAAQSSSATSTSGSASAMSELLGGSDFSKLLELQLTSSALSLGEESSAAATSIGAADTFSSLLGQTTGGDGAAQLQSLLMLRLFETVVDRLSVLQPAATATTAAGAAEPVTAEAVAPASPAG